MKSTASQSSSSRYSGTGARVPKSSGVSTSPAPKIACQTRFTATRAVSGDRGSASQRAKPSRFRGSVRRERMKRGRRVRLDDLRSGWSQLPRSSRCVLRRLAGSRSARCRIDVAAWGNVFHRASISSLIGFARRRSSARRRNGGVLLGGPRRGRSLQGQHRGMIDRRRRGSGLPRDAEAAAAQHVGHPPGDLQLRSRRASCSGCSNCTTATDG